MMKRTSEPPPPPPPDATAAVVKIIVALMKRKMARIRMQLSLNLFDPQEQSRLCSIDRAKYPPSG